MLAADESAGSTTELPVQNLKNNIILNYTTALNCAVLHVWKAAVLCTSGTSQSALLNAHPGKSLIKDDLYFPKFH